MWQTNRCFGMQLLVIVTFGYQIKYNLVYPPGFRQGLVLCCNAAAFPADWSYQSELSIPILTNNLGLAHQEIESYVPLLYPTTFPRSAKSPQS
ncbi:hypothetical protein PspLS_06155 [Pyricularia sp. CBS 133598]|nr:hypothetical protein PspLS_06155 [Pyricularia sp. CBS 133598]